MGTVKSFPIYKKRHASGNLGYRVDMGIVRGKRTFKSFTSEEKAQRFQRSCLEAAAKERPVDLQELDDISRHEVLAALSKLKAHGANITNAVDFFLKHNHPEKPDAAIGDLMAKFKELKHKAELSTKYLETSWASFFVPFRDHFKNCRLSDVTKDACEKYIYHAKTWNATTRQTHLRHLTVLFNFAIERKYCTLNPFKDVQKPKRPSSKAKQKVLTVEQVIELLQYALKNDYKPECAALVLIFFCGVRVDEVARVRWNDIKLDEDKPLVVLDETKANRRRVNPIPENAVAWLKILKGKEKGNVTLPNYLGRMRYLRKVAKSGFKQNSARISFASYHVAKHEDPAKTSLLLGHQNPTLLYSTYKAVVSPADAERYWKITPDYNGVERDITPSKEEIDAARMKGITRALGDA